MWLRLQVEVESSYVDVKVWSGSTAGKLYSKWKKSNADEDFEEFADYIREDAADDIEFYITDASEMTR